VTHRRHALSRPGRFWLSSLVQSDTPGSAQPGETVLMVPDGGFPDSGFKEIKPAPEVITFL